MKFRTYPAALAVFLAGAAFGAGPAAAGDNDALAVSTARIDLARAVNVAERQVGGKASRAEYVRRGGQSAFDVEIVKGTAVMDVKVDASSGRVIATQKDEIDHDDGAAHAD